MSSGTRTIEARRLTVRGAVQGVGFRPFVARLADAHRLSGWVLNDGRGVEIHVEGPPEHVEAFAGWLQDQAPPAAQVDRIDIAAVPRSGAIGFLIRDSQQEGLPTARITPDLPVCEECLGEMSDPSNRRFEYAYINCTSCGPRYSILTALPYDRERTTMARWPLCPSCEAEYRDSRDRRFHAEPVACPECGPAYHLVEKTRGPCAGREAVRRAAVMLRDGHLLAIKGVGGYHLCCDATNAAAVAALRNRKYRKSRPFAVMARDLAVVRSVAALAPRAEALLTSRARPIVLLPGRATLHGVAPDHRELGVMLPYAPIHHLLFRAGAPDLLVMTSANRSSEPIAYEDGDAADRLSGIADAFLIGDRAIARRVDDSVVRSSPCGRAMVLRRSRGYSPAPVARCPSSGPVLAVGADLKNTVAIVIGGDVIVSQHVGDLEQAPARAAFQETIRDLVAMYGLNWSEILVAHDAHPHYASTAHASSLPAAGHIPIQHHRAHVASVLAERAAWDVPVVGVAFDGTGYGDDGTIWGGEFFVGSVSAGLTRAASLRPFRLPGGDAAARSPVQAAAGILGDIPNIPDLMAEPFGFPKKYDLARRLAAHGLRTFSCTSAGRVFDAVAALLGFTRDVEYEGQAAEWLEQLAWRGTAREISIPVDVRGEHLDLTRALGAVIDARRAGLDTATIARAFHEALAASIAAMALHLAANVRTGIVVASGGTFQNALLLELLRERLSGHVQLWTNEEVPPNDGGISLGQAALATFATRT